MVDSINDVFVEMFKLYGIIFVYIVFCLYVLDEVCECCKFVFGMVLECVQVIGLVLVDSWVIGDKVSDVGLVNNIGGCGIFIFGEIDIQVGQVFIVLLFSEVVDYIF